MVSMAMAARLVFLAGAACFLDSFGYKMASMPRNVLFLELDIEAVLATVVRAG